METEFRKLGFGTGRVNANMQPKLTQFMKVKSRKIDFFHFYPGKIRPNIGGRL